ncbi:ribosomal protein S5, isoform CRA_a [Rattus norvegicus]|uniref:Ribosomal protein S5, isoform CRA_a n=1 Tax=Rattus norvegicus TaxID=10116 RepID=A6KQN0_RAT|nr:ribosomal protein S5, isoform CRA_a [Rattus norvegicus]
MTEWETATPAVAETPDIKLFGKWSTDDVQINDISLQDYIAVKEKYAKYLPHSAGRYAAKRFRKAQCPIVERLTNSMMMHGRNNGKKLMTVRIVKHAFEIIHLLTGEWPPRRLNTHWAGWNSETAGCGCIPTSPSESGHLAAVHGGS